MMQWFNTASPRRRIVLVISALMLVRLIIMIALNDGNSLTIDEPANFKSAMHTLDIGRLDRIKDSEMPVTLPNAVLFKLLDRIAPTLDYNLKARIGSMIINLAAIPIAYVLAIEIGATSVMAVLFAAIIGFEPTILAHSMLIHVDGAMATFFMLLMWSGCRWTRTLKLSHLFWFGLILGLLQGVKFSAAYAVPLCCVWVMVWLIKNKQQLWHMLLFLVSAWLGLNFIYGFNGIGMLLLDITFKSTLFKEVQQSWLGALPTVFPVDYLRGLDWVWSIEAGTPRNTYILGNNIINGVWYYFLVALLLKSPIFILLLSVWGWLHRIRSGLNPSLVFLLLIFISLFFYFSVLFHNQIGIRYILPIYPILLLGIVWIAHHKKLILIGIVITLASMVYQWPNYIGYFNDVIPENTRWQYLSDSNLSWKQDSAAWQKFIEREAISPQQIDPPLLTINQPFYLDSLAYLGIYGTIKLDLWFIKNFSLFEGSFRNSWLIFRVPIKSVADAIPLDTFPAEKSKTAMNDCAQNSLDLIHGSTWVGSTPRLIIGEFVVPKTGEVLLQSNSTGNIIVYVNEHKSMKSEPLKNWTQYNWRAVRYALAPGHYPFKIEIVGEPFETYGFTPPLSVYFSATYLHAQNSSMYELSPLTLCNVRVLE